MDSSGAHAAVTGGVANLGAILVSEDRIDGTVEIEGEARAMIGPGDEVLQQSIVHAVQMFPEARRGLK
jgi:hypothetical protein